MQTMHTHATPTRVCEIEESRKVARISASPIVRKYMCLVSVIRSRARRKPETGDRRLVGFDRSRLTRDTSLSLSFSRHVIKRQVSHAR